MQKHHRTALILFIIFCVVVLVAYIYQGKIIGLFSSRPSSSYPSWDSPSYKPSVISLFQLKVNRYSVGQYGYYEVVGEVKNISNKAYRFVQVKAVFYNSNNQAVGEETAYACATDYILPDGIKSFKFMGQNQPDYKTVRCEIISYREVD